VTKTADTDAVSSVNATENTWAPRQVQEKRLSQIDELLSIHGGSNINARIERAVLLAAVGRRHEAQDAFVSILRQTPNHFDALNEFGSLLTSIGSIEAACRVYSEAVAHHPQNPIGHVNLGNLFRRLQKFEEANTHYEQALIIDPENQPAHQGLGAVHSDLGNFAAARVHFKKGYRNCAVSTLPYRGTKPPLTLLQLVSSGGGNIPADSFLDDRKFLTTVIVADYLDPDTELPPHNLIFNTVGDADLCQPALQAAIALTERTPAPVINHPRSIVKTGRVENARLLGMLPDVSAPRTITISRTLLEGVDAQSALIEHGFVFPLLIRSPGFHTGRNFVFVESGADLATKLADIPGDHLLIIEYLNARGLDGNSRKYRVMFIDGVLYPLHLAVSRQWKVHYFTADMVERSDYRLEEAAFLSDMPAVLGARAITALGRIRDALGLDYGGIDFALGPDGDVLLFEANATMVVIEPPVDERWDYRRAAVRQILDAVVAMMVRRASRSNFETGRIA
jgi:hypothetical protein